MFTPTKKSLEELGFYTNKSYSYVYISDEVNIYYDPIQNHRWSIFSKKKTIVFYPDSIDDIQTLIRLLSPNNN